MAAMAVQAVTTDERLAEIEERLELFKWVLTANGPMRKQSISHKLIGEDVPWLIEQVRRRDRVRAVS